jgi:hypothetical protein
LCFDPILNLDVGISFVTNMCFKLLSGQ